MHAGRCVAILLTLALAVPSAANDRLPHGLQGAYGLARREVHKYLRYILEKVWRKRLAALKGEHADPAALAARADGVVDDIVHILLPYATKVADDVIFGTGETYLKVTMPNRGLAPLSKGGVLKGLAAGSVAPADALQHALEGLGASRERELNDRLQQALTEDLEDLTQREVEGELGLPVRGRPRDRTRALTDQYERPYREKIRREVHRYMYWRLRKKERLELTRLARSKTQDELDRAWHTGDIWGMTSAASYEAWAMNRLEMDFKWGRPNWEIDRRRIRRRMDQDQAQAAWALAKLARELTSPETVREAEQHLGRRIEEELSKEPLREKAEQFPKTGEELRRRLERLRQELDPIADKAMDRVKLPPDIAPLAREHGRRFLREEQDGQTLLGIQRHAAALAAAKRVRAQLPQRVADALARFDPGRGTQDASALRRQALEHVKKEVAPEIGEEIEASLRDSGLGHKVGNDASRSAAVREVVRRTGIDKAIESEVHRQLRAGGDEPRGGQ